MLTKQLQAILDHLSSLKDYTKEQKQLLHELKYIDKSPLSDAFYKGYSYHDIKLESFAPASGNCPNCGKKY